MEWHILGDNTLPVITAKKHINSSHGNKSANELAETCVVFEIGIAMNFIEENYNTITLSEELPCFLYSPKCVKIKGIDNVCFTRGGYGAPSAVDTLETVIALGVKKVIVAGMCGCFDKDTNVGNLIIPHKVLSEEGTSHHYFSDYEYSYPNSDLYNLAIEHFKKSFCVITNATVTCDAVYRQTFKKEALWREKGCIGVDMESSALLAVARYYDIPAVTLLLASDKHPLSLDETDWKWGNPDFSEIKKQFIKEIIEFAKVVANYIVI